MCACTRVGAWRFGCNLYSSLHERFDAKVYIYVCIYTYKLYKSTVHGIYCGRWQRCCYKECHVVLHVKNYYYYFFVDWEKWYKWEKEAKLYVRGSIERDLGLGQCWTIVFPAHYRTALSETQPCWPSFAAYSNVAERPHDSPWQWSQNGNGCLYLTAWHARDNKSHSKGWTEWLSFVSYTTALSKL